MSKHLLYLALGSNLGDSVHHIKAAYRAISKRVGQITAQSAFYVTAPEGFESDHYFLNTVCIVSTTLDPYQILEITEAIERKLGRTHKSHNLNYSDRVIDIDLLLYDNLIVTSERLTLPHPRMHQRDFVLRPLASIAPDAIHPVLDQSITTLQQQLETPYAN